MAEITHSFNIIVNRHLREIHLPFGFSNSLLQLLFPFQSAICYALNFTNTLVFFKWLTRGNFMLLILLQSWFCWSNGHRLRWRPLQRKPNILRKRVGLDWLSIFTLYNLFINTFRLHMTLPLGWMISNESTNTFSWRCEYTHFNI